MNNNSSPSKKKSIISKIFDDIIDYKTKQNESIEYLGNLLDNISTIHQDSLLTESNEVLNNNKILVDKNIREYNNTSNRYYKDNSLFFNNKYDNTVHRYVTTESEKYLGSIHEYEEYNDTYSYNILPKNKQVTVNMHTPISADAIAKNFGMPYIAKNMVIFSIKSRTDNKEDETSLIRFDLTIGNVTKLIIIPGSKLVDTDDKFTIGDIFKNSFPELLIEQESSRKMNEDNEVIYTQTLTIHSNNGSNIVFENIEANNVLTEELEFTSFNGQNIIRYINNVGTISVIGYFTLFDNEPFEIEPLDEENILLPEKNISEPVDIDNPDDEQFIISPYPVIIDEKILTKITVPYSCSNYNDISMSYYNVYNSYINLLNKNIHFLNTEHDINQRLEFIKEIKKITQILEKYRNTINHSINLYTIMKNNYENY